VTLSPFAIVGTAVTKRDFARPVSPAASVVGMSGINCEPASRHRVRSVRSHRYSKNRRDGSKRGTSVTPDLDLEPRIEPLT
jgi:hypothetical protein